MPPLIEWLPAPEAARRLAPFLPNIDPALWLTDLRRRQPVYRTRLSRPPYFERRNGRTIYPLSEIDRVVDELRTVAHAIPYTPILGKAVALPSDDCEELTA
ncbi:hypothetical protein [Azospirillum sp. sgz302134]